MNFGIALGFIVAFYVTVVYIPDQYKEYVAGIVFFIAVLVGLAELVKHATDDKPVEEVR